MAGEEKTYCYSDVASSSGANLIHHTHLLHSFDPNPEMYNLTSGMEMIGFPPQSKNQQDSTLWKGVGAAGDQFYHHHDFTKQPADLSSTPNEALQIVSQDSPSSAWTHHRLIVDDPSLRCGFPYEENERPSQGLSLSLNSSNPSSIGLQSFQLRSQQQHDDPRFGPSSSRSVNIPPLTQEHSYVRNSKYLGPAQELLNEFCNLGTNLFDSSSSKLKVHKASACQDEDVIKKQSLFSLDGVQLQIRKSKLLQMLEEVDGRYKRYRDQMKTVVSSFEAWAGSGAATVYSALASKAMSRHFRCLRDGMVAQIKATKKAIGEKDAAATAPGTMKGETPRLRLIDQTLRQQRALQQMSMMESHPWRPQRGLPERSVSILRAWLFEHFLHPYPSDVDKHILARQTGLSRSQVSNWFINARVRLWKPMVEEMYLEELKESEGMGNAGDTNLISENNSDSSHYHHHHRHNPSGLIRNDDQKPTHDQLARIDTDCLSSIINTTTTTNNNSSSNPDHKKDSQIKNKTMILNDHQHHHQNISFGKFGESMELDFSSYNPQSGVSLTLGLHQHQHQHNTVGLSLGGYSQTSVQNSSLFYSSRDDHMETVQYSLLDGSENQNLPYRNLMGAQLLHDLAG